MTHDPVSGSGESEYGGHRGMDAGRYLARIGLDPDTVTRPDLETLARLQRAHATTVPFENLDIVGRGVEASRIVLSVPDLYEKIVERRRGGYCFELNGLFHWLLDDLGYDVDRIAAMVTSDGEARPPANHHTNIVNLDRRYVVDVGMGTPAMRVPVPLDGTPRTDDVGVEWRLTGCDRPDEQFRSECRTPGDPEWSTRYVFSDVPRSLDYFGATNDYLQTAPESPFTDGATVTIATEDGHRKLSGGTLTETNGAENVERTVPDEAWSATVRQEFGLDVAGDE